MNHTLYLSSLGILLSIAFAQAAGSKSFTYTQLPGYGHNVWGWTFGNKEILDWLFAQKIVRSDFCQNNRYAEANTKIEAGKVMLLGDSIMASIRTPRATRSWRTYSSKGSDFDETN